MKKLFFIFIIGAVVAWYITNYMVGDPNAKKQKRAGGNKVSVAIEAEPIKISSISSSGIFTGSIEAFSKATVAPKISGRVKRMFVDIGDKITNGGIIAKLDDEELVLDVQQSEANLEIAKANYNESAELLTVSQRELQRIKTMYKQKVASEVEVENTEANHKTKNANHLVNKAQLAKSESLLAAAKLKLAYTKIDASWTEGSKERFVAERFINEGNMITANTPVVSVIDIDNLKVVLNVVEKDYQNIKIGMVANVNITAIPNKVFKATVTRIAPQIDESSRQARIELTLPNPEHEVKPGMFATAEIVYSQHENVLVAPVQAVVSRDDKSGVFVVDRNSLTAKFVPVTFGFSNNKEIEIVEPKIQGEVVTLGQHLLEDGMGVKIADSHLAM